MILAWFSMEGMLIVLVIVLVLFGGKKIPELMRGVGQGVGEFKRGISEPGREEEKEEIPKEKV